jgi:hypothetical protein
MKVIQSFWSAPYLKNEENTWLNKKVFLYSQVISLYKLLQLNYPVHFYTDDYGKKIFGEYLNLPFQNIHTVLNDCSDLHLWTKGKIKTYKLQTEPFIHIDSDVFIGKKLKFPDESNYIFCQSYYSRDDIIEKLKKYNNLPEFIQNDNMKSICMGIFATDNLKLIHDHSDLYFQYAEKWKLNDNLKCFRNTILEELLMTILAEKNNIKIKYLFDIDSKLNYEEFKNIAEKSNYSHIGGYKKGNHWFFEEMKKYVEKHHPSEYSKIQKLNL